MEDKAWIMDVGKCIRHSGAQPGGGICAVCLQEKLMLLWRGEGNSKWNTEDFSITPPLVHDSCHTPLACDSSAAKAHPVYKSGSACFPLVFRIQSFQRDDVHESSKSSKGLEREKIDRGYSGLDVGDADDHSHQFSCEIKSIMKELAALHEKKKLEKAEKRQSGIESGCISARRHQYEEAAAELSQASVSKAPALRVTDAVPADYHVPKAKASIIEDEVENGRLAKATLCFSALWPGQLRSKLNMKWAKVLVNPVLSSNKIVPSKSDLAKTVNGRSKVAVEETVGETVRDCETSGVLLGNTNDVIGRARGTDSRVMPSSATAPLPPRHVQRTADEDGCGLEIDNETAMRMEASRITVLTWLESLPSPKVVHLKEQNSMGFADDLSLGNGVLEMCDEEDVEFDYQPYEPGMDRVELGDAYDSMNPFEPVDAYNHINSFGMFLRTGSSHVYAPSRMVDVEIAAQ